MEPNLRFILANCIPSIASTEKTVPLKIDKLIFHPFEFIVNDISYKLRTFRNYPPGVTALVVHQTDNSEGGVSWDLDQHGFKDHSSEAIVTPGDVAIKEEFGAWITPVPEEHCRRLEEQLRSFESVLTARIKDPSDKRNQRQGSTESIQQNIDRLKADLDPFYCRRNDTRPKYTTMVQFTVTYPNEEKKDISRESGDSKLYKVQKELADRLFGNRKTEIFVKHLDIAFWPPNTAQVVIRLPLGFQIKVREISTIDNVPAVCDAVEPLIHRSSYPLERFLVYTNSVRSSAHPIICTAKQLLFGRSFFVGGINEFLKFPNQWIYLCHNLFTSDEYITLLRRWIEDRRKVGTCLVSNYEEQEYWLEEEERAGEELITNIFVKCKEQLNGYDAGERSIKVPLSESSEINLSYQALEKQESRYPQWKLTIEVVAV